MVKKAKKKTFTKKVVKKVLEKKSESGFSSDWNELEIPDFLKRYIQNDEKDKDKT